MHEVTRTDSLNTQACDRGRGVGGGLRGMTEPMAGLAAGEAEAEIVPATKENKVNPLWITNSPHPMCQR